MKPIYNDQWFTKIVGLIVFPLFAALIIKAQIPPLVEGEYFFDVDPGKGNGIAIPFAADSTLDLNVNLDLSGLSNGFHKMYFRFRDGNDVWSLSASKSIFVETV
jgi:hypothetical protein